MGRSIIVDRGFWKNPDIQDFTFKEKFVYLYLITNESVTTSGIYPMSVKTIANECGFKDHDEVIGAMNSLVKNKKILWDKNKQLVFVKNAFKHNKGGRGDLLYRGIHNDREKYDSEELWAEWNKIHGKRVKELKDSGANYTKGKVKTTKELDPAFQQELKDIAEYWNTVVCKDTDISLIQKITAERRIKVLDRIEEGMKWKDIFDMVKQSDYLCGRSEKKFLVTFDWVFWNDTNWRRVAEGNYSQNKKYNYNYKEGQLFYKTDWLKLPAEVRKLYETVDVDAQKDGKLVKAIKITKVKY